MNLDKIQTWITQGRLDPKKPITIYELMKNKVVGQVKDGIKLLAKGKDQLQQPINIVVSRASQSAIEAVEAAGGTVTTRFYTELAVKRVKSSLMHPYISMKWDPASINKKALIPSDGAGLSIEERVTGLGYQYRLPDPSSRKEIEYYRDPKNRGYLSHLLSEREGPSLFWKPPISEAEIEEIRANTDRESKTKKKEENLLW